MVEPHSRHLDHVFRALAHPARRAILRRIAREEQSITELAAPFDMSLEAVSRHIQVLEPAKLLRRTRRGRLHCCRLRPSPWGRRANALADLAGLCVEPLGAPGR